MSSDLRTFGPGRPFRTPVLIHGRGIPFHATLSKVNPSDGVPRNAVLVTLCTTIVLACVIIGSTIACASPSPASRLSEIADQSARFNNILSICNAALIISYIFCIATLVAKRLRGEKLPPSRFNLGKFGIWINCIALGWLSLLALVCVPRSQAQRELLDFILRMGRLTILLVPLLPRRSEPDPSVSTSLAPASKPSLTSTTGR